MKRNQEKIKVIGFVLSSVFMYKLCQGANIEKLIKKCDPKVVKIGAIIEKEIEPGVIIHGEGVGSGSFIDPHGIILTCAHVVNHKEIKKLFIKTSNDNFYRVEVTKLDTDKDLALLKIIPEDHGDTVHITDTTVAITYKTFPYFKLGKPTYIGQQVLLFGSPLAIQGCVSIGWIENIVDNVFGLHHLVVLHNAPTNPGNSGGPLVDLHGRLVGVGEGVLMMNPFVPASGLGFAIDVEEVQKFLKEK